jgi:hypothetical protein
MNLHHLIVIHPKWGEVEVAAKSSKKFIEWELVDPDDLDRELLEHHADYIYEQVVQQVEAIECDAKESTMLDGVADEMTPPWE